MWRRPDFPIAPRSTPVFDAVLEARAGTAQIPTSGSVAPRPYDRASATGVERLRSPALVRHWGAGQRVHCHADR